MAKSRINRKEFKRLKQKDMFRQATEVRLLVERLPNQQALDTFLLQVEDIDRRKNMFEFCKPFIKFANPQFPTTIKGPELIIRP
jgi:hypothetical protein